MDAGLIRRWRAGDQDAVAELVQRYQGRALRLAVGLLGGSLALAEDAVQEAFVKALSGVNRVRPGVSFGTWLYQCVVWECRSQQRRWRRWERRWQLAQPVDLYDQAETRLDLTRALARLPIKHREVLLLRYYAGLSESDVADLLGCRRGTVKSRISRAITMLRRQKQFQTDAHPRGDEHEHRGENDGARDAV